MASSRTSLAKLNAKIFDVPLWIVLSMILLIWGVQAPMITLKELVFWQRTFSVITGIENLFHEKYYTLACVIVLFSVIFPFAKLATLFYLWAAPLSDEKREFFIRWLHSLGKWSMLDVFVVAVTIVISKISMLAKAEPHIGIYIFGSSILLSMVAVMRMEHLTRNVFLRRR